MSWRETSHSEERPITSGFSSRRRPVSLPLSVENTREAIGNPLPPNTPRRGYLYRILARLHAIFLVGGEREGAKGRWLPVAGCMLRVGELQQATSNLQQATPFTSPRGRVSRPPRSWRRGSQARRRP